MKIKMFFVLFVTVITLSLLLSPQTVIASLAGPGDIAFTGFNADGTDDFAFVALVAIDAGQVVYFNDNEWDGAAFTTGEGVIIWTAPAGGLVGGALVTISDASSTPTTNLGTVIRNGGFNLAASDEALYAYLGTNESTPTNFLSAIANDTFNSAGANLNNTGLTISTNAIEFSSFDQDADVAAYVGSRSNQTTAASYNVQIHDLNNWISQDGTGDQSIDGIPPDVPFDATFFTTPTAVSLQSLSAQATSNWSLVLLVLAGSVLAVGMLQRRKTIGH